MAQLVGKSSKTPSPKMKVNWQGILGLVAIALMVGIAIHLSWHIIWWYFILSILIYSITVISLTTSADSFIAFRFLLGCHLAFLFLAGGLWLNFPNFFVQVGIFLASVAVGLVIPFLLLREVPRQPHQGTYEVSLVFNGYGLIGLVPIALIIGIAFYMGWNIIWWHFVLSILLYSITVFWLTISAERSYHGYHWPGWSLEGVGKIREDLGFFRWLLGCHLAFLFLAGGLWLNFPNFFVQVGIFLASVAVGLVIPFLLIRR